MRVNKMVLSAWATVPNLAVGVPFEDRPDFMSAVEIKKRLAPDGMVAASNIVGNYSPEILEERCWNTLKPAQGGSKSIRQHMAMIKKQVPLIT